MDLGNLLLHLTTELSRHQAPGLGHRRICLRCDQRRDSLDLFKSEAPMLKPSAASAISHALLLTPTTNSQIVAGWDNWDQLGLQQQLAAEKIASA